MDETSANPGIGGDHLFGEEDSSSCRPDECKEKGRVSPTITVTSPPRYWSYHDILCTACIYVHTQEVKFQVYVPSCRKMLAAFVGDALKGATFEDDLKEYPVRVEWLTAWEWLCDLR
jgi:hypothetical protein